MTALGFLYPGHSAEDDYPRIEVLMGGSVRLHVIHTDIGEDAHRVDALLEMGSPARLGAGVEELRHSGAEAVVWACTSGSFVYGWDGAHDQVRALAQAAGLPASSTSFAFAHAVKEIGASRVAVAATYPDDVAGRFSDFLKASGTEVVQEKASGIITAAEVGTWGRDEVPGTGPLRRPPRRRGGPAAGHRPAHRRVPHGAGGGAGQARPHRQPGHGLGGAAAGGAPGPRARPGHPLPPEAPGGLLSGPVVSWKSGPGNKTEPPSR